jgi:ubiquitin-like-conjugating enzyme ATG3
LRRATSLAYTDADEDAERLLSFGDADAAGDGDEWVETHAGRKPNADSMGNVGVIDDIPDLDGPASDISAAVGGMSLEDQAIAAGEIPDMDDIPDMEEEDLEGGDEATAAPKPTQTNIIDARSISLYRASIHH